MCKSGRGGTDGTTRRNKAPASRGQSAKIPRSRKSCKKPTIAAYPTITSWPPKLFQARCGQCPQPRRGSARSKRVRSVSRASSEQNRRRTRAQETNVHSTYSRCNAKRRPMLAQSNAIAPHGGQLVDRRVSDGERQERLREARRLTRLSLDPRALSDLQMSSTGVFSPLEGFMGRDDYESVLEDMRLASGLAWSIPVTLATEAEAAKHLKEGSIVALVDRSGELVATMLLRERYRYDKEREARKVYRTTDKDHPGVANLYRQGDVLLGGEVELIQPPDRGPFPQHYYEPEELRALFAERGWNRVVGFQTC